MLRASERFVFLLGLLCQAVARKIKLKDHAINCLFPSQTFTDSAPFNQRKMRIPASNFCCAKTPSPTLQPLLQGEETQEPDSISAKVIQEIASFFRDVQLTKGCKIRYLTYSDAMYVII